MVEISKVRWRLGRWRRSLVTMARKANKSSDPTYWSELGNHRDLWDDRTGLIAGMIAKNSRVLEFGAGRRQLEGLLPESCSYTASDIVPRGPDTVIVDLNERPLPNIEGTYDVAVFGGVLEYVHDVPEILAWLNRLGIPRIIATYECAKTATHRQQVSRAGSGWVNSYTADELRKVFQSSGYGRIAEDEWRWGAGSELILSGEVGENAQAS